MLQPCKDGRQMLLLLVRASCCSNDDGTLAVQERGLSPCVGDGVTFRISTHLATAKAAEKSDAAAAKHAGAHRQGHVVIVSSQG